MASSRGMRRVASSALAKLLRQVRFREPEESEFRASFEKLGRVSRGNLWIVLLAAMVFLVIFQVAFLRLPPAVLPFVHVVILGVMLPAVLRWLSSQWGPLHRWSAEIFVAAALIDVACLMWLRVACLQRGYDVVPLILPVGILMSLIVAQIRFLLLAPVVLLALAGIVGVEPESSE